MSIAGGSGDVYFYTHMIAPKAQMSFHALCPGKFPIPRSGEKYPIHFEIIQQLRH
jgi:hypothetical protein